MNLAYEHQNVAQKPFDTLSSQDWFHYEAATIVDVISDTYSNYFKEHI